MNHNLPYKEIEENKEEEDDEEDDEEEPKLKFQRLGSAVSLILKDDRAQCLIAREKFMILGTHNGMIHLLDLSGNEVMRISVHSAPINDMSLDNSDSIVATCSDDGTVVVTNLHKPSDKVIHHYHRPIKAVALPRNYEEDNMFATGGLNQHLIINTKGWLRNNDNILHKNEGTIHAISWKNDLIAWANNLGIKIFDIRTRERITYINRPNDSPRPELYHCCLRWKDNVTLIVAWADSVKIAKIKTRNSRRNPGLPATHSSNNATSSDRFVQIVAMFQTDFWISGIAPFGPYLVILAYIEEEGKNGKKNREAARPELRFVNIQNEDLCSDALPIYSYQYYKATDYRLACTERAAEKNKFFYIVSPKDIVIGRPRDVDDRLAWLLTRRKYKKAFDVANENVKLIKQHKLMDIGDKYLRHLMEMEKYSKAASFCSTLLGQSAKLWETWVLLFVKHGRTKDISPYIPTNSPQLSDTVYEMVLSHFLKKDHIGFRDTIHTWPTNLYNMDNVITAVVDQLGEIHPEIGTTERNETLLEALGYLYTLNKQYTKAVHVYLELQQNDVFDLVKKLDLFEAVRDKILPLMQLNQTEAIELFIENNDRIPIAEVVEQLASFPKLQHEYLHALFVKDNMIGYKYHEKQVRLYAEYSPDQLMPFLTHSTHYILEDALHVCREKNLFSEMVFILNRMGNLSDALSLIIDKIKDVKQAISFVEEHKDSQLDSQLLEQLITESLNKPKFLSDLLEDVGSHYNVDMPKLIRRIPNVMHIPDFKKKLRKILSDYLLEISVRKGCNSILLKDCVQLSLSLNRKQRQAMRVEIQSKCVQCNDRIFTGKFKDTMVFSCKHIFHTRCIYSHRTDKSRPPVCLRCHQGGNNKV